MKTAISVPNDLFERAEKASKKLRMSRSELYTMALDKFLETRDEEEIARKLREFYSSSIEDLDPALAAAGYRIMKRSEW